MGGSDIGAERVVQLGCISRPKQQILKDAKKIAHDQ